MQNDTLCRPKKIAAPKGIILHPRMPDKAPTCADAQTVAGAPAGADVNMETGAGSPTGAVAATDALTGPPAAVSATAAAVPLLRGLSQDNGPRPQGSRRDVCLFST